MPGKGKRMAPEHASKIGEKTSRAYSTVNLCSQLYEAGYVSKNPTEYKTILSLLLKVGKVRYDELQLLQ
jgi:hypothetical protein